MKKITEINSGLNELTINKINIIFAKYPNILKVILYGSRAKGNFKNGSDIDLTIESDDLSFENLLQIENEIDDLLLPYSVDLSLKKDLDHKDLIEHIERVGVVFFEKLNSGVF